MWMHDQGPPTEGRTNLSLDFVLTGGERHGCTQAIALFSGGMPRRAPRPRLRYQRNPHADSDHGRTSRDLAQTRPQGEATLHREPLQNDTRSSTAVNRLKHFHRLATRYSESVNISPFRQTRMRIATPPLDSRYSLVRTSPKS